MKEWSTKNRQGFCFSIVPVYVPDVLWLWFLSSKLNQKLDDTESLTSPLVFEPPGGWTSLMDPHEDATFCYNSGLTFLSPYVARCDEPALHIKELTRGDKHSFWRCHRATSFFCQHQSGHLGHLLCQKVLLMCEWAETIFPTDHQLPVGKFRQLASKQNENNDNAQIMAARSYMCEHVTVSCHHESNIHRPPSICQSCASLSSYP